VIPIDNEKKEEDEVVDAPVDEPADEAGVAAEGVVTEEVQAEVQPVESSNEVEAEREDKVMGEEEAEEVGLGPGSAGPVVEEQEEEATAKVAEQEVEGADGKVSTTAMEDGEEKDEPEKEADKVDSMHLDGDVDVDMEIEPATTDDKEVKTTPAEEARVEEDEVVPPTPSPVPSGPEEESTPAPVVPEPTPIPSEPKTVQREQARLTSPPIVRPLVYVDVPDFNVPVVYGKQEVYVPRALTRIMKREMVDEDTDMEGSMDRAVVGTSSTSSSGPSRNPPPWIGGDRNLSLFEPSHHPLFFPPAATGFNVPDPEKEVSPFGVPLSDALPKFPSKDQAEGERKEKFEGLIPLESAYAGGLHPLPSGLVNSLGKRGHRHHHHHHRRDRRRSSVGEGQSGVPGSSSMATGTQSTANAQTAKVASSVMIPGTSAYALPPAYATNRRGGTMTFDQIQAQNEELSHQRASHKDREEVDLVELGVGFTVNPVARMIKRNNKCMMSRDWKTVWREIQFTRALERVEQLKDEGAWSFRQMKKFRGPPLTGGKSHWDWMLDEMRWMQADFKEERRWKIVLASEMASEVRRWHKADGPGKAKLMVGGVGWGVRRREARDDMEVDKDGRQRLALANETDGAEDVLEGLRERDEDVEAAKEKIELQGHGEQPIDKASKDDTDGATDDAEGEEDGDGEPDEDAEGEKDDEDEDAAGEVDDEEVYAEGQDVEMSTCSTCGRASRWTISDIAIISQPR